MKILIVEDERTIRETLKEILEEEGYQVETESVGTKVVEKVKEFDPDVIILDLFLPGKLGIDVLKELNDLGETEKRAVIIVSGHGTVETAVKAMKLGARDFIEKPIEYNTLLKAIENSSKKSAGRHTYFETYSELPLRKAREEFERNYIVSVLEKFDWNLKKAAKFMGIDISNLYRKINKYSIEVPKT